MTPWSVQVPEWWSLFSLVRMRLCSFGKWSYYGMCHLLSWNSWRTCCIYLRLLLHSFLPYLLWHVRTNCAHVWNLFDPRNLNWTPDDSCFLSSQVLLDRTTFGLGLRSMLSDKVRPLYLRISERILIACIGHSPCLLQNSVTKWDALHLQPSLQSPHRSSAFWWFLVQSQIQRSRFEQMRNSPIFAKIKFGERWQCGGWHRYNEPMGKNDGS